MMSNRAPSTWLLLALVVVPAAAQMTGAPPGVAPVSRRLLMVTSMG